MWRSVSHTHISSTFFTYATKNERISQLMEAVGEVAKEYLIPLDPMPKKEEGDSLIGSRCSFYNSLIDHFTSSAPTIQDSKSVIQKWRRIVQDPTISGKFEWVNGILLRAMNLGHWLLIDHVNLCASSVLDRLNCLVEPNGILIVNERGHLPNGEFYSVRPHPNFRLFLTLDPANGDVSRAMRNRAVEFVILPPSSSYSSAGLFENFDL